MNELVAKIRWCYQMMHLTLWITERAADDHTKRLLARFAFLYIDSLSKLLPRAKNQLKQVGNVAHAEVLTKRFADDYEKTYAPIRDRLAAHRQGVPLNELYDLWFADIDAAVLCIFLSDVEETHKAFQNIDANLPALEVSPDEADQELKGKLEQVLQKSDDSVRVGGGSFDPMAPNTVALIPRGEYQPIGSRLLSIHEFRVLVARQLLPLTKPGSDCERLFKMAYLTETVSLIDNMYPHVAANPAHQHTSYLELARKQKPHGGLGRLEAAYAKHDPNLEAEVRNVRNKIAAHVDAQLPLADLLATLDGLGIDKILSLGGPAFVAFAESWRADPRTMMFGVRGPAPGAIEVEKKDTKPFQG